MKKNTNKKNNIRYKFKNIVMGKIPKYRSLQVSPDGEAYIFDYEADNVSEIWDKVADQGSKWIFYSIPFVVANRWCMKFQYAKVIDAPQGLEFLKGKTIRTAMKYIKDNAKFISSLYFT